MSLFGSRVIANVVNMMSYRCMVGLPPSMTGALGGGEIQRQRTQGEDDHVMMETETGARHPEVKECHGLLVIPEPKRKA